MFAQLRELEVCGLKNAEHLNGLSGRTQLAFRPSLALAGIFLSGLSATTR